MIKLDLKDIQEFLKQLQLDTHFQKETGQLTCIFKVEEKEYPLFFRIFEGGALLQVLVFIPTSIKDGSLNDTARLLHLLNKEVDIPGFGMEEQNKVVFYRIMIPGLNQEIEEKFLEMYLNTIQAICKTFSGVIFAVANNSTSFEDVMKKASEAAKNQ